MNILEELYTSDKYPLSDEEKVRLKELHEEMLKRIDDSESELSSLKKKYHNLQILCESITRDAIGCVDAVRAMLRHSDGTHRMRDFYNTTILNYIDNVRKTLRPYFAEKEDEELPF